MADGGAQAHHLAVELEDVGASAAAAAALHPEAADAVGDVGVHEVAVDARQAGEPRGLAAAPEGALGPRHGARGVVTAARAWSISDRSLLIHPV